MLAGELYDCGDEELLKQWHKAKDLIRDYNRTDSADAEEKGRILKELLGGSGKNLWITAPFFADYGNNIYFGNNCEVNMNCTFLDDNKIVIGDNALIAPNVQIYTAFHPTNLQNPDGARNHREECMDWGRRHYHARRDHRRQCGNRRGERGHQRYSGECYRFWQSLPGGAGEWAVRGAGYGNLSEP